MRAWPLGAGKTWGWLAPLSPQALAAGLHELKENPACSLDPAESSGATSKCSLPVPASEGDPGALLLELTQGALTVRGWKAGSPSWECAPGAEGHTRRQCSQDPAWDPGSEAEESAENYYFQMKTIPSFIRIQLDDSMLADAEGGRRPSSASFSRSRGCLLRACDTLASYLGARG